MGSPVVVRRLLSPKASDLSGLPLDGLLCYLDYVPSLDPQVVPNRFGTGGFQVGSTSTLDTNDPPWSSLGLGPFDATDYHALPTQALRSLCWVFYTSAAILPSTPEIKAFSDASTTNVSLGASTGVFTNEVVTLAWVDGAGTGRLAWVGAGNQITAGNHVLQMNFDGTNWRIKLDGVQLSLSAAGTSQRELPASGIRRHGNSPSSLVNMTTSGLCLRSVGLSVQQEQQEYAFLRRDMLKKHGMVLP